MSSARRKFRILALDGGANAITYPRMLRDLIQELGPEGRSFFAQADLITGCSFGSVSALYLAIKLENKGFHGAADLLVDQWIEFADEALMSFKPKGPQAMVKAVEGSGASFDTEKYKELLQTHYGDARFHELKTRLSILSYKFSTPGAAAPFHNYGSPDEALSAIDVVLRSSAYPVSLPMVDGHLDGCMISNNPSMAALSQLIGESRSSEDPEVRDLRLDDIVVLSLGGDEIEMGRYPGYFNRNGEVSWGWKQWLGPNIQKFFQEKINPVKQRELLKELVDEDAELLIFGSALLTGNTQGVALQCQQLLPPGQAFRMAPQPLRGVGRQFLIQYLGKPEVLIDDSKELTELWREDPDSAKYQPNFNETIKWLKEQWFDPPEAKQKRKASSGLSAGAAMASPAVASAAPSAAPAAETPDANAVETPAANAGESSAAPEDSQPAGALSPPPSLESGERVAILKRLKGLVDESRAAQFKTQEDIPADIRDNVVVGQYPSHLDFSLHESPDEDKALLADALEGNGSSFMGLWFLSGSVPVLREIGKEAAGLVGEDPEKIQELRDDLDYVIGQIIAQLETARDIPKFFQGGSEEGTTRDVNGCPQYTMGWYPLVDIYRLPAVIPDSIEAIMKWIDGLTQDDLFKGMSNLSDGDIWSWCLGIDDTTPGILRYFGEESLKDPAIIRHLLGTYLKEHLPQDDLPAWLNPYSIALWETVSASDSSITTYPIQTFYNPTKGPKGAFSCAVIANILGAIPTLGQPSEEDLYDIDMASRFVNDAVLKAIAEDITWQEYAYDYYTVPVVPVAYLLRAHRNIVEISAKKGLEGYPMILDDESMRACATYVSKKTRGILAKPLADILQGDQRTDNFEGNEDYATLIYCFLSMMNVWAVDPALYHEFFDPEGHDDEKTLVGLAVEVLLTPNSQVNDTPGTGPYQLGDLPLFVTMSSICFMVPPLLEAFSYYLLSHAKAAPSP